MSDIAPQSSPRWNTTTKLVVSLTLVALAGALVIKFKYLIGPVLIAFILAYILYPSASGISRRLHLPWKLTVTILYLLVLLSLVGLLTWGGISIVNGFQSFLDFSQNFVTNLPGWIDNLSKQSIMIGPFTINLSGLNFSNLLTELQSLIQPLFTKAANVVGSIATGAASVVTWIFFTFLVSYFITAETAGTQDRLIDLVVPVYQNDFNRLGKQLSSIWNAFLRGQLIVLAVAITWYTLLLGGLGINYFFWLALLAGLARFIPYVGPFILYIIYFLVAIFQGVNLFGLTPFAFAVLVVGISILSDVIIDNFVSPRVMSNALEVHPAAVLVTVLISASLFGFIGMLLAAPVLATVKLLVNYALRKLTDQDPWEGLKTYPKPEPLKVQIIGMVKKIQQFFGRIWSWIKKVCSNLARWIKKSKNNNQSKEM